MYVYIHCIYCFMHINIYYPLIQNSYMFYGLYQLHDIYPNNHMRKIL